MIATVRGPLLRQGAGFLIIEVGGLGVRVEVPSGARAPRLGRDEVFLHTTLIVREDALTLFGFETVEEIDVFEHMITVSGVGPKSALGVLSAMSPAEIARAVHREDDKAFRQAPGIGPKTSKLLIVSLAGKLDALMEHVDSAPEPTPEHAGRNQVLVGLQGLGWTENQAREAVEAALTAGAPTEPAQLLRSALKLLQAGGAIR